MDLSRLESYFYLSFVGIPHSLLVAVDFIVSLVYFSLSFMKMPANVYDFWLCLIL